MAKRQCEVWRDVGRMGKQCENQATFDFETAPEGTAYRSRVRLAICTLHKNRLEAGPNPYVSTGPFVALSQADAIVRKGG